MPMRSVLAHVTAWRKANGLAVVEAGAVADALATREDAP